MCTDLTRADSPEIHTLVVFKRGHLVNRALFQRQMRSFMPSGALAGLPDDDGEVSLDHADPYSVACAVSHHFGSHQDLKPSGALAKGLIGFDR